MIRQIFLILLFVTNQSVLHAQQVYDGHDLDSTTFTFEQLDSLTRPAKKEHVDTSGALLWKIGTTSKTFFSAGALSDYAIMTDTSSSYAINANDWFVLKLDQGPLFNVIVSFWHKYQTTSKHDGGIVEYSVDSGLSWMNLLDTCNADTNAWTSSGVTTHNFYGWNDTLLDGTRAFTGSSNGWQYSRFQFFYGLPVKGTAATCLPTTSAYVRFRFVSDGSPESLDGWIIDNLRIERDHYSAVKELRNDDGVAIHPNPASDYLTITTDGDKYSHAVLTNGLGQVVVRSEIGGNVVQINIKELPPGLYFLQMRGPEAIAIKKVQKQ
jgi:hypothetical protein